MLNRKDHCTENTTKTKTISQEITPRASKLQSSTNTQGDQMHERIVIREQTLYANPWNSDSINWSLFFRG